MNEEKVTRLDPRSLIPPHLRAAPPDDDPPPPKNPVDRWLDEEVGPRDFWVFLLALGIAFALVGMARLGWNIAEEGLFYEHCSFCGFQGFFLLDKSMPYFVAFALFVIAAGTWRHR